MRHYWLIEGVYVARRLAIWREAGESSAALDFPVSGARAGPPLAPVLRARLHFVAENSSPSKSRSPTGHSFFFAKRLTRLVFEIDPLSFDDMRPIENLGMNRAEILAENAH